MNRLRSYIIALSLMLASMATAREIYNSPASPVSSGIISCDTLPTLFNELDYHLRLEIPRNCAEATWSVKLTYADHTFTDITIKRNGTATDDSFYGAPIDVCIARFSSDSILLSSDNFEIIKNIEPTIDAWSLTLKLNPEDSQATFALGQRSPLLSIPVTVAGLQSITATTDSSLKLARLSMFVSAADSLQSSVVHSPAQLNELLATSDNAAEGLWRYLDRDTDLRRINLGANYILATVAAPDGTIEILYLGHNGNIGLTFGRWKPLMLKGKLTPTVFLNHYDLTWYDASGSAIIYETSADIIDGAILKLNFPIQGGSVRFQKAPINSAALSQ